MIELHTHTHTHTHTGVRKINASEKVKNVKIVNKNS